MIESDLSSLPPVVAVRLRNMTAVYSTGLHALENLADLLHESGRHFIVCGIRQQPNRIMERAEFHRHIGSESIVPWMEDAVARARELLVSGPGKHPS